MSSQKREKMFKPLSDWLLPLENSHYEQQIKWDINLSGKDLNQDIVAICKDKKLDPRKETPAQELKKEALVKLRQNMYDPWGNIVIYRGIPSYRIKE